MRSNPFVQVVSHGATEKLPAAAIVFARRCTIWHHARVQQTMVQASPSSRTEDGVAGRNDTRDHNGRRLAHPPEPHNTHCMDKGLLE